MNNDKEYIEQRIHQRFKVKSGVTAAIIEPAHGNDYIYLGEITNISEGGLAFQYADRNGKSNEPYELDILVVKGIVCFTYFKKIPFKTAWISDMAVEFSSNHLKYKQRGVQFGEMTPPLIPRIDTFFRKYTIP